LLDPTDKELVNRHITGLNIINRYDRAFKEKYMHLLKSVDNLRKDGQDVASSLRLFKNYEKIKSVNSWGHIFYSAVLANPNI
jgi:hypothetical protein